MLIVVLVVVDGRWSSRILLDSLLMVVDIGGIFFRLIGLIVLINLGSVWWWLLVTGGLVASRWVLDFFQ